MTTPFPNSDNDYAGLSPSERLDLECYDLDVMASPPHDSVGWTMVAAKRKRIYDEILQHRTTANAKP